MDFKGARIINVLIVIAALFGGYVVYSQFLSSGSEEAGTLQAGAPETSSSLDGSVTITVSRLNSLISRLEAVTLDTSVLTRADFLSLTDFSVPVDPEPQGVLNPFGPPPF